MGKTLQSFVCAIVVSMATAVCTPATVHAQRIGDVGVRAQGMAGAFTAVADDATATWWNPAGLANSLSFVDFTVEVDEHSGRSFALSFPSLGVSYYHLNISQIQPFNSTGASGSGRQDLGAAGSGLPSGESFGVDQFGVTVGQSIGGHLAIGSTLKFVRAQSTSRADLDLGVMAALGLVRLGVVMRNVSSPTFGIGDAFELSRRARTGVAVVAPMRGKVERVVLGLDADLTTTTAGGREERDLTGGAEVWLLSRRIGIRGGAGTNTVGEKGVFGAWGVSVSPYSRVTLDGALTRSQGGTRDRWSLDLRLTF